jgi:hypothetical protein
MMRRFLAHVALAASILVSADVGAEPLDAATCGLLKGEQTALEQAGVRNSMAKGPEWARANLGADKLQDIRRLMHLDEQLLFRCAGHNLVDLPDEADADPAAGAADGKEADKDGKSSKDDAAKRAPPLKPSKAQSEAAAKPKAAPPSKQGQVKAGPAETQAAKPKPKPKPKEKVDDAYKPPPVDPKVDPFANQPVRR